VQASPNTGYKANSGAQVVITLPSDVAVGDVVRVSGVGTGGWKIAQNAGQSISATDIPSAIGVPWSARDSARNWMSVASSADGRFLAAAEGGGKVYTSSDAGATWTAHDTGATGTLFRSPPQTMERSW